MGEGGSPRGRKFSSRWCGPKAVGGGRIVGSVDVLLATAVATCWAILAKAMAAVGATEHSEQVVV